MTTSTSWKSRASVLAAIVLVAVVAVRVRDGGDDKTTAVTAMFTDANPIVVGDDVKASGVSVGSVKSVRYKKGLAEVKMKINDGSATLHKDALVTIKSKNILGERFVDVDPGSASSPELGDSAVIPTTQTRREVDLQEVLNSVDTPTSTALGAMLTSMGEGMNGQGKKVQDAIKALAPAMTDSGELAKTLDEQNQLLTALIDNAQPVATALAGTHGTELDHLVTSMTQTLAAVSAQREQATATLRQLPETLVQARTTLARLSGVADPTTEVLKSMRPVTGKLTDISAELEKFSAAADPALASLAPVLDQGKEMLDEARPLVRDLRPAGASLRGVARSGNQLAETVLGDHLTQLMEFMKGWALATSDYDAISHYFKAIVPVSPAPLGKAAGGLVPGLPDDPLQGLPLPKLPGLDLSQLLPGLTASQSQTAKPSAKKAPDDGSATGLTSQQENSLLSQLLGGK